MKRIVSGVLLAALVACSSPSAETTNELPILGRKYYDETIQDTVYHTVGNFSFVNQDSALVTPETLEGKIYVADFFFTSCPTICPVMKKEMLRVYDAFKDNPEVVIVSHTIDPEYDTVALLHDYAERLGVASPAWQFVTGEKDSIFNIALKSYMVTAAEEEQAPGGRIHSGAFILVRPAPPHPGDVRRHGHRKSRRTDQRYPPAASGRGATGYLAGCTSLLVRGGNWLRVITVCFTLTVYGRSQPSAPPTNALIHETSPYLLQHARNPVD